MKGLGYAKGYRYPHDFKGHFVDERYLPDAVAGARYYEPSEEGMEKGVRDRLRRLWPGRFGPEEK